MGFLGDIEMDQPTPEMNEQQLEKEFEKRLNRLVDENASEPSGFKRLWLSFKKPSEAQKVGKRAFARELFLLSLRAISPFTALHRSVLLGTFGLSQAANASEAINRSSDWASNRNIYIKTRSSLTDEIAQTMPEVEWEMKSSILDNNLESFSNSSVEFVRSRAQKYSSFIGVMVSTVALAAINPALLTLGIPAYLIGQYLSGKRAEIEKVIFPHERKANNNTFRKSFGISSNVEQRFIQNDRKSQGQELRRSNEDLTEVSSYRQKRQRPFIWQSIIATTALTGLALATAWTAPLTLLGVYAATNAFLGSLQSWSMSRHTEREILRNMMRHYEAIKHQKEFDLQTGKQKLPEKVDSIEIDKIQYRWRKISETEIGAREEKPVLDFSKKFYFLPGINILGGVSGAGKSTLYKLMRHFDDVSRGSISVGTMKDGHFVGKKLTDLSIDDACNTTAFSFSRLHYEGNTTGIELIQKVNPQLTQKDLEEISGSEMFDVPLWMDSNHTEPRRLSNMSDGQKARISTICALVSPRKILVLDEPTSRIDKKNIKKLLAYINRLGKRKTIIYTTHNPTELLKLDVSNIVYLDQQKDDKGNFLPTDVKVYQHPSDEEKRKYVNNGSLHDPQNEEEKLTEQQEDEENDKSAARLDALLQATETAPKPKEKEHINTDMRNLLRSEHMASVMRLHEIAKKGPFSRPKTIIQKMLDYAAHGTIRRQADPKKHKRLYRATHHPDR